MSKSVKDIIAREKLEKVFGNIGDIRVMLLGDMCVDIYWSCDMTKSTLSRETPHFPYPVTQERMSPGAGGNVVSCMNALGVKKLKAAGIISSDWRGECLKNIFAQSGIDSGCLINRDDGFTNAYIKPMLRGYSGEEYEASRIDFENHSPISTEAENALLEMLDREIGDTDLLVISDQFEYGIMTETLRSRVRKYISEGLTVAVDSRMRIGEYGGAILKPNEIECSRALGRVLPDFCDDGYYRDLCISASDKFRSTVCMTAGARGAYISCGKKAEFIPAVVCKPPVDTVGAGDCFISAFAVSIACGLDLRDAAMVGNMASAISVKKTGTTGSASQKELYDLYDSGAEITEE